MCSTRRAFTGEYKANAVALVLDGGRTPNKDAPLNESEREELERLRREVVEARMAAESARSSSLVRMRPAVKFAAIADWTEANEVIPVAG